MCQRIEKTFLSTRDINEIKNDCFVEGKDNGYGPAETLRAYAETPSSIYVPFAYAKKRFKDSPNKSTKFPQTSYSFSKDYPFRIDGGRDQEVVFKNAIQLIKKHKSVLLSLFCGFGKCLGKDTPILMYDGTIKMVQNIKIGDLLMGDDSTPRRVLTLAHGREELFQVIQSNGESYIVNKSHILSLYIPNNNQIKQTDKGYIVKWFDHDKFKFVEKEITSNEYQNAKDFLSSRNSPDVIDISVKEYLKLPQDQYHGYKVSIDFAEKPIDIDPYTIGYNSVNRIPHNYKINSRTIRLQVLAGIIDSRGKRLQDFFQVDIKNTELLTDIIYITRSLGFTVYKDNYQIRISGKICVIPTQIISNPIYEQHDTLTTPIRLESRGIGDYYGFTIDGNHRFLLGDFTVTHNTFTGIKLAHASGLKCGVLAHRGVLFDQWVESINKFTNAKVQIVDTDGVLDPDADFYIFNIAFVHKYWNKGTKSWKPKKLGIYKNTIGILIVDEAHIACASEMSKALLYFNPRVAIALTATPHREDGMDKALELYFGDYDTTRIIRIAKEPFLVYRLPTGIKPIFTYNSFGKKDWNSVITSLIESDVRNKLIIRLIEKFSEFTILVLTKRKTHCNILATELKRLNITNTVMTGTTKKYDKTARVLLSTYSKLGVGFDDGRLNMLIVACSVKQVEQYAGRLRDSEGKKRVVIDLVDTDPNCQSHWSERRKWYISRNGDVKNYYQVFPEERPQDSPGSVGDSEPTIERPKRLARVIKKTEFNE